MSIDRYITAADRWFTQGDSGEGSFVSTLFDLCNRADHSNKLTLFAAFPDHVGAWIARNVMGGDIVKHLDDEREWVVRPGDPNVGNWLISRQRRREMPKPCIKRTMFGAEEIIDVSNFVHDVVQDEDAAYDMLLQLIDPARKEPVDMNGYYGLEPSVYEQFEVVDRSEIISQMHDVLPDPEDDERAGLRDTDDDYVEQIIDAQNAAAEAASSDTHEE